MLFYRSAPTTLSEVTEKVKYQDTSSLEVTNCKGEQILRSAAYVTIDFIESRTLAGAPPETSLVVLLESKELGAYNITALLGSKTRTLEVVEVNKGAHPPSKVSVEAQLEISRARGESPQTFFFKSSGPVEHRAE